MDNEMDRTPPKRMSKKRKTDSTEYYIPEDH